MDLETFFTMRRCFKNMNNTFFNAHSHSEFRSHGHKLTIIMEKDLFNKGKGVEDVGFASQSQ
jgi:hypothetical protein